MNKEDVVDRMECILNEDPEQCQHFDEMMTSTRHSAAADVPALALRLKRRARFYESLDNLRMALV